MRTAQKRVSFDWSTRITIGRLTSVDGVSSLRGLTRKHDTVRTVENSVGDIADLSTSGAGVVLKKSISHRVNFAIIVQLTVMDSSI